MNIIEALQLSKEDGKYYWSPSRNYAIIYDERNKNIQVEDILANDWEYYDIKLGVRKVLESFTRNHNFELDWY